MKVRAVFTGINNEIDVVEVKMGEGPVHDILRGADYLIIGLPEGGGTVQYSKLPKKRKAH